jgi:hypothetical protein
MSELKVNKISPRSGTDVTLGDSGDTITVPSGATITNSGTATGFGKVLQVVTATDSTRRTTTSTSWVTSSNTLSVTITPSSASNKIFIELNTSLFGVGLRTYTTIFRDSTNLGDATYGMSQSTTGSWVGLGMSYLDSPSSTSAITYQFYWQNGGGASTAYMNGDNGTASITAFEIAG